MRFHSKPPQEVYIKSMPSTGGIGFCGLLTLVFITLKLLGVIAWSWWWVLSPLWIPVALVLGIWAIFMVVFVILATTEGR